MLLLLFKISKQCVGPNEIKIVLFWYAKILLLPFQSHNNWQILCFLHLIERSLELSLHGTVCFSVFYRIKTDFRKIENEVTTKMSWLCL